MKIFYFALPIFLLAVNIVSGQVVTNKQKNATQSEVDNDKNRVITFIDCYGVHLKYTIDNIPSLVKENLIEINVTIQNTKNLNYDNYFLKLNQSLDALHDGLSENFETNKTNCFYLVHDFEENGFKILENTRSCLLDKIQEANNYVAKVADTSNQKLSDYYKFKNEVNECTNRDDCDRNEMLKCIKNVSTKSTNFMLYDLNDVYKNINKMNDDLLEMKEKLSECETNELKELNNSQIVEDVQTCAIVINPRTEI